MDRALFLEKTSNIKSCINYLKKVKELVIRQRDELDCLVKMIEVEIGSKQIQYNALVEQEQEPKWLF